VLSPDGNSLAFAARSADGEQLLWVRSLDGATERALAGTEGATFPFWSFDSRSLAFFANGKLYRIDAAGGPLLALCDAASGRGGAWGTDGTILFALLSGPIFRVPAYGGAPQPVTKLTESLSQYSHRWPQFLPDARHFLFLGQATSAGDSTIYIGSLDGGEPKLLLRNESSATYAPPGYLLFVRQGTLLGQKFDANKLQLTGDALPLAGHDAVDSAMAKGNFSVSENGILVYASGAVSEARLLWFDRPLAGRFACFPILEVRVARHHLSQYNIQCLFRAGSNEPSEVFEQIVGLLFEGDIPLQKDWLFRIDWHLSSPFSLVVLSLILSCGDRAKTLGGVLCDDGRERPHGSLSRPRARKVGRSRPTPCCGPVAFLRRLFCISLSFLGFARFPGDVQPERPAEYVPRHPVHPDSWSLARKSDRVFRKRVQGQGEWELPQERAGRQKTVHHRG
jgi:hypothetical protein